MKLGGQEQFCPIRVEIRERMEGQPYHFLRGTGGSTNEAYRNISGFGDRRNKG